MEPHGIPWKELIIPQAINFSIFLGLLVYFVRKPLRSHFSGKSEQFEDMRKKAEETRIQAERQNQDVRNQLHILEDTSDKSFADAKKDAHQLREKMLNEAKNTAEKLEREALKMSEFEYIRAVSMLRQELVITATSMAQKNISENITDSGKAKLNDDFVMKIQAAKA